MKQIFTLLLLSFSILSNGQEYHQINFDSPGNIECIIIDTVSNPNNIWQIGPPQKSVFTSASSAPNVIVTDTLNTYPVNDTSSFIILHEVYLYPGASYCGTSIYGEYYADMDEELEYCSISLSDDLGNSWYELDSLNTYNYQRFSGSSSGWESFDYVVYPENAFPWSGDTLLFKFTFVSDAIQTNKEGIMFDDFALSDCNEGIEENSKSQFEVKVYPDPADDFANIEFENIEKDLHTISIFDSNGKIIDELETSESQFLLNTSKFYSGVYFYKILNSNTLQSSSGKFVKR